LLRLLKLMLVAVYRPLQLLEHLACFTGPTTQCLHGLLCRLLSRIELIARRAGLCHDLFKAEHRLIQSRHICVQLRVLSLHSHNLCCTFCLPLFLLLVFATQVLKRPMQTLTLLFQLVSLGHEPLDLLSQFDQLRVQCGGFILGLPGRRFGFGTGELQFTQTSLLRKTYGGLITTAAPDPVPTDLPAISQDETVTRWQGVALRQCFA
jgi:hypothetical protein